ncbi:FAS1-like dehydratase domain-containing protein [Fictibacillus phosphorivorans]|uniref:FAS1-like dehydratase domain-containing protein n=1 Tax=Fictibacillus phosphorivorans TaxID=1221500 RepID=UPI00203DC7D7|nr:MaoC family dehydratase N-terminal domain-containing protein [Fictibacillus phosphorivorans]MCM3717636.1 MaoC family dehydratase N-terminal domain-containing protein [Fictibacillus phosphorivorans]MCM3775536.1 MaoC family dehydratase N-terminal domain-containing protein [Fictibacillus phosphorivorans]
MDFKQWEGATTLPVSITVTKELVDAYYETTGFLNNHSHHVPPALPMIFYQYLNVPWIHEQSFIHKDQKFHYEHPISIGDTLQCTVFLKSVKKRRQFLVLDQELIGKNEHQNIVFSAKSTLLKEAE